jgi:hypothetical protein
VVCCPFNSLHFINRNSIPNIPFSISFILVLGFTQPPMQRVLGTFLAGGNAAGTWSYWTPNGAKIKKTRINISIPPYACIAWRSPACYVWLLWETSGFAFVQRFREPVTEMRGWGGSTQASHLLPLRCDGISISITVSSNRRFTISRSEFLDRTNKLTLGTSKVGAIVCFQIYILGH